MAGHSKWAQIKRKKAVTDSRRGALFTKLVKNITVAAKSGGDPDMNPSLRTAIDAAQAANMPKDNIEKAILKGTGELPGVVYEEILYEGYGPGGIALLIECVTDNTNRTVSFVRSILTKSGGSLGSSGSVLYMFTQKGIIRIAQEELEGKDRDAVELAVIDAGADDIHSEEEGITITTARDQFHTVLRAAETCGVKPTEALIEWVTNTMVEPDEATAEKVANVIEILEENEDISAVYTNARLT